MDDDNQANQEAMAMMKVQIEQLVQHNEALHASMESIQQQQHEKDDGHQDETDDPNPQPLFVEIWNAPVLENFKPP